MEKITRYKPPSLWSMLCILLVTWIIGSAHQGIAESTLDNFTEQKGRKTLRKSERSVQEVENFQLAKLYYAPEQKEYQEEEKRDSKIVSVQLKKKIRIMVIGGVFLIIGSFFIPHLIPQFTGYHGKLYRFFENAVRMYKTILQNSQNRSTPRSVITDPSSAPLKKTKKDLPIPEKDEPIKCYTIRCENILSPVFKPHIPKTSTIGMIRKFFQQSGFAFTEISDAELRVTSSLSRYKCYGDIPVYVANGTALNKSHIQKIYAGMNSQHQQPEGKSLYGKIAFVVVTTPLEDSAYHQIYNYRVKHNFTIIPLSHLLVTKSVRHSSCAQELEEKLSLSTGQCNLYALNTPVADSLSLFGRDDVIQQLLDAVNHQKHVRLFGLRKIGKTWLIWQLKEQLSHHIAVYIDLQCLPRNCSDLYRKIVDECVRDARFKYPDLELPDLHFTQANYTENDHRKFIHDIVSLWECMRTKRSDIKIVLLLDRAGQLASGASDTNNNVPCFYEFLAAIRNISQQHGFLVSIMVFTSPEIPRRDARSSRNIPEARYDKKLFLSSLFEDRCDQMINAIGAQMGLIYTEESLSRLYYETGGHPYVTRQVCSLIAKNLKHSNSKQWSLDAADQATVRVRDVEQAVSEYIEYKSHYLESVWQQLSHVEQEIMWIITTKHSCTFDDFITAEHSRKVTRDRREAISVLVKNDLIEKCENKYSIKMGLFERLILANN